MKKLSKSKIVILIVVVITIILGVILFMNNKNGTNILEYDILIEDHRYQYEGVPSDMVPEGGYSTTYYYKVVNSEKKELYTVIYQDVWQVHNDKGDKDTISIEITSINDQTLQEYVNKYGKVKKSKLKNLLNNSIKEEYVVEEIINKVNNEKMVLD